jgi:hypothetical protein
VPAASNADGEVRRGDVRARGGGAGGCLVPDVHRAGAEAHSSAGSTSQTARAVAGRRGLSIEREAEVTAATDGVRDARRDGSGRGERGDDAAERGATRAHQRWQHLSGGGRGLEGGGALARSECSGQNGKKSS